MAKKNGRPRKSIENQRGQVMHVRMTEREAAMLAESAGEMNLTKADYIRHRVWGKAQGSRKANPERSEIIKTVSKIGSLCSDLRRNKQVMSEKEAHRLYEDIRLKLSRYPSGEATQNLKDLADALTKGLTPKERPEDELLMRELMNLSQTLMDYLNGRYQRKTKG